MVKPENLNVSSSADHLRVERSALRRLLNGRAALTPGMAIRFEKAFGISALTPMRMRLDHDLAHPKRKGTVIIGRMPELAQEAR